MDIYRNMPGKSLLLRHSTMPGGREVLSVNAHMHTPYSFSAFASVRQALDMAVAEGVKVAGINDFNTTDGYPAWAEECINKNIFPLFNIEFIALSREDQEKGILVNDPSNPGRTYLSGKGLAFPNSICGKSLDQINRIKIESNRYTERLCERLNGYLVSCNAPFQISFNEVLSNLTMGNIRERHLAKALRLKIAEYFTDKPDQADFYRKIFGNKPLKNDIGNAAGVENEIRSNLLKAGGPAFVPESPESFVDLEGICRIIIDAGGIPTYPFLADNAQGNFTDFEEDLPHAVEILKSRGIWSVEFIPGRNTIGILEKYAGYCHNEGLIVTFGTEHNTPQMEPVTVYASKGTELTPLLKEINYTGACIVAAHQYLIGIGEHGYINMDGTPSGVDRDEYIRLGHALIRSITNN